MIGVEHQIPTLLVAWNSWQTDDGEAICRPFVDRGQAMMRRFLIRIGVMLAVATALILDPLTLIGGFISTAIGSLVSAVILRAAAQWIEKRNVPYGDAYLTVSLGAYTNLLASILLRVGIIVAWGLKVDVATMATYLVMIPFGFFVQVVIIGSRLRISFDRACLICAVMLAIAFVMALFYGGFAYFVMTNDRW
jgi:hypothetical protein